MELNETPVLLILGFFFLVGLAADLIGRSTAIPRVTLLILSGLAIGPFAGAFADRRSSRRRVAARGGRHGHRPGCHL